MATITKLQSTDNGADSLSIINTNLENLNTDKLELSDLSGYELLSNKETSALDTSTTKYPCNNVVKEAVDGKISSSSTDTLTNKTLIATTNTVEEISTIASSATPAPTGGSLRNFFTVTALAADATFAAPSGTPANGNYLTIRIKDDGTSRALDWNAVYRAIGVTLPPATTINKTLYIGARYNSADSKWDVLAVAQEA